MREQQVRHDVTVVGGGLAGVCAAIAAARLGRSVALINNRPVLGGNSSSEIRVWVVGATAHGRNHFARETGIMGELFVENQYRNPEGNPYYWDAVVLDAVRAEPLISLYLNTDVREVSAADGRIESVTGWTMGSELLTTFTSPVFLDCTGDGLVGALAGASFRVGREARSEYDEPWAPDVADEVTLGSTLLFYSKDAGEPVRFVPPSFTKDIAATSIPSRRVIRASDNGCAYWWIEFGGELDTVHDNEAIRDELWAVVYGIWDHIKNSGSFPGVENLTLEWVGAVPGKREYRRFVGDYVLTQHDVLGQTAFDDRVAFGGWSIDLHPPGGMYAQEEGAKQRYADGIYHIPYRILYSRNVTNLMMAGRNVSASHVAFGTTRVQATTAVMGEAAGTAAALAVAAGVPPRSVEVGELQRTLLRQDASIVGLPLVDPLDLASSASVSASGSLSSLAVEDGSSVWPLEADAGLVLPVHPSLPSLELLVDAAADTSLTLELYDPGPGQNYVPRSLVSSSTVPVPAGSKQWVRFDLSWAPSSARNAFVLVRAAPGVALYVADRPTPGVLSFTRRPLRPQDERPQPLREWTNRELLRRTFCFRSGSTEAFAPDRAVDGYLRPFAGPHLWVSSPSLPAWLQLSWPSPVTVGRVELIGDDDVDEDLINLHRHRTPFPVPPPLVRDYAVEALVSGAWVEVASVAGNRRRRRVHELAAPVTCDALRVVVTATNGAPAAHVVALRAYAP
ncbi:FAD-dependent oxidoreductase [Jiangella anatolica]|uniref:Pyridine nucleotide-disulfide oxidoreductase n=1 Tax=Jiangella anatolica TaxID=2670374 RepID=A0A2W2AXK7_9ACTN|nr:FAD-dependent oxidoreductase [Jiangella anatolica]PZF79895.1 pyridine nucleotide-disulfide oxidoreductase [Jiangella anatolica]